MHKRLSLEKVPAPECRSDRSCLHDGTCGDHPMCDIVGRVSEAMVYVAPCPGAWSCRYGVPFGDRFLCTCPVRIAMMHGHA